eukprot:Colp12_sorted_trinity150504_noHs@10922
MLSAVCRGFRAVRPIATNTRRFNFAIRKMSYEQLGSEGRRVDAAPKELLAPGAGLIYFGNRTCPFAHRAWWTVEEKGVKFDYIHIELGDNKPAWYQAEVNPYGTVPCIYHDGKAVFESLIVAEYIEESFKGQGSDVLPADPKLRADVRLVIAKFGDKVTGKLYGLLSNKDPSKHDELANQLIAGLKEVDALYEKQSNGPFFLGENISLADIALLPFFDRFNATLSHYRNFSLFPHCPRIHKSYEAAKSRPAFQKTSQDPELYIKAYAKYAN